MCGIVAGFDKKKDVNEDVLLQFEDQSSRGTNGFGSIFMDETGKFSISRATGQIKAILDIKLQPTKMLIFHHRQPSSSKNKISQTHPILISSGDLKYDYYIVHNGVIHNDDERKKHHNENLGYTYSTEVETDGWYGKKDIMFNDSEVLGYDIARFIEGQTNEIKTAGSAAFIMVQVTKKHQKIRQVFYGRNSGNPLKLAKSRDFIFLSSEGKGEAIKENMLYSFAPNDFKIKKKKMAIPTSRPVANGKTEDKDDKKEDKDDDDKPNGRIKHTTFDGYAHSSRDYNYDDEWMAWEEEEELDRYFNAAQLEMDNLKDTIKEAINGEELYLIDTEDIVKNIAVNLSRAVEYARNLKVSTYFNDPEDDGAARDVGEDYPGQEEDAKQLLAGEAVELPDKTSAK